MVVCVLLVFCFFWGSTAYAVEILMGNEGMLVFEPCELTISVGDMVEFVNDGGYHDVEVTSGPELLSLPPCSGPCTIGTLTFNLAGTYDYICSIGSHASNGMVGIITVEETNSTSTSVQVIHNSASPTVDVYIDGVLSVEGFAYRTATPVLDLGTDFTVGIAPAGGDVIANFPFSLEDGGEYVVVATGILNDDTAPFNLAATSTIFGATDGNVGLNVYHGSTDAPSVDVLADGSVLVSDLMYGEFSGFVEVAAADYTIGIAPTGGTSIADFTASLSGLGGESAVVFASGFLSGDDPAFGLFAALGDGSVLEFPFYDTSDDGGDDGGFDDLDVEYFIDLPDLTGQGSMIIIEEVIGLEVGDEIGIFDAEAITNYNDCSNQIGELLVGAGVWTGEQLNLVSIGSNDLCSFGGAQFAGFVEGNDVIIKVYRASEDMEYATELTWGAGSGVFLSLIHI